MKGIEVRVRRGHDSKSDQFARLPDWLFDQIEQQAESSGRSFSHVVYLLLKRGIAEGDLPANPNARAEAAE